ncbi:MAG: two-component regulator propeller domain-containing protein [Acidobacteriota bacterium]
MLRRVFTTHVWVLLAALAPSASGLDPGRAVDQYNERRYLVEDGLPQGTVRAIAQTADGYLWIGTRAGLARFDGRSFTVLNRDNTPELLNQHVRSLAVDNEGTLWVGTNGNTLLAYRDRTFVTYGPETGLPGGPIISLLPGSGGDLWVGTYGAGLARLRDGRFEVFGRDRGLLSPVVVDMEHDGGGGLWLATHGAGLVHMDAAGRFETFDTSRGLADDFAWALQRSEDGALWIGTEEGLHRMRDGRLELFTPTDGLPHRRIISLTEDRDGQLWIGTYGGGLARRCRDGGFEHLSSSRDSSIRALFEDRGGILWSGSLATGLGRLDDGHFVTYGVQQGLPARQTTAVYEASDGVLWVATRDGSLSRLDGESFSTVDTRRGQGNIWSITGAADGGLWFGTSEGLEHLDGDTWSRRSLPVADELARVYSLRQARDGALWVGTDGGLVHLPADGPGRLFNTDDGLPHGLVRALLEDRDGNLWVGTVGGLARVRDGGVFPFTEPPVLATNSIYSLHEDDEGAIWIGTLGGGLVRYLDGKIDALSTRRGLVDDDINVVLEDAQGHLWLGSSLGVVRVPKAAVLARFSDPAAPLPQLVFGRREGFGGGGTWGGGQSGAEGRDGRLWFAHQQGVSSLDPRRIVAEGASPVILERVEVDGERFNPEVDGDLPPYSRAVTFRFTAPALRSPDKVRFRFRLQGFDDDWTLAELRQARYTNLGPGPYEFQVEASDFEGRFSGQARSYRFSIRRGFVQSPAFFILCALSIALMGYGLHLARVARLRSRERRLEQRVEAALADVKVLGGLLPICGSCKKIRDDAGYWNQLEVFIDQHSEASFSHGLCPACTEDYLQEIARGQIDGSPTAEAPAPNPRS